MNGPRRVYLVSFDTDRIKDYIFATTDLKKIRGASSLLESLNKDDTPVLIKKVCQDSGYPIPDEHIVTAGGAAMAVAPTRELAEHIRVAVERLYRQETVTGTITGAYLGIPEDDVDTPSFGQHVARLSAQLRRAKDSKGYEPAFPLKAYTRPCNACGRHPAIAPDPDEPDQALCSPCLKKHEWNKNGKNRFHRGFQDHVARNSQERTGWLDVKPPKDFGNIGRTSRPPNYMGFILADGNGIGSLLEKMQGFKGYHHFATKLDQLIRDITCNALLSELKKPRSNTAPFEILFMGGDDLMVVAAADAALNIALRIVEEFEVKATELARRPEVGLSQDTHVSLSAGVVIAHHSFPIKAAHDLADELLRSAKRKTSEDAEHRGAVDFMVVTEASTAGLGFVRNTVLTEQSFAVPQSSGDKFSLTQRPYTAAKLKKLLDSICEFKKNNFPSRSLHRMYEALFHSRIQAQIETLTVLARAKEEHRNSLLKFFHDVASVGSRDAYPWRREEVQHYSTALGDLVEIYPFVQGGR